MTERDPLEDVLGQFRPVGPRPDMQFPVALRGREVQRLDQHRWRGWQAAGVLAVVAAGIGAAWIHARRSESEVIGDRPVVARMAPQEGTNDSSASKVPRVTITGDAKRPVKIGTVSPAYPEEARAQQITGTVFLEIVIGTDGTVSEVEVVRSVHPDLDEAAVKAVSRWRYVPTKVDDQPVEVVMVVDVTFRLD